MNFLLGQFFYRESRKLVHFHYAYPHPLNRPKPVFNYGAPAKIFLLSMPLVYELPLLPHQSRLHFLFDRNDGSVRPLRQLHAEKRFCQ